MHLSDSEIEVFYKLHPALLFYANSKLNIVPGMVDLEQFIGNSSVEQRIDVRNALANNIFLIDSFVSENPNKFSENELDIVKGWKQFVKGDLYMFRFLKDYTVFVDWNEKDPKAYGVYALQTPFEEMVPNIPFMVNVILLPFNRKIIYDGMMTSYRIFLGGGIKRSLAESYNKAKAKYGIITDLMAGLNGSSASDEEMLKFYLKNETNRARYSDEIQSMISKNQKLLRIYYQENGKSDARYYGKKLREIGIEPGWFAILEGVIVASGETPDDVSYMVQRLVPNHKIDFVYYYQLKRASIKNS